jgi:hypothetical protein
MGMHRERAGAGIALDKLVGGRENAIMKETDGVLALAGGVGVVGAAEGVVV